MTNVEKKGLLIVDTGVRVLVVGPIDKEFDKSKRVPTGKVEKADKDHKKVVK